MNQSNISIVKMTRAFPGNARAIWPTARSLSEVPKKLHLSCALPTELGAPSCSCRNACIACALSGVRADQYLRRETSIRARAPRSLRRMISIRSQSDLNQISIRMAPLLVITLVITLLLCLVTTVLVIRLLITLLALTLLRITLLPLVCALLRMTLLPPLAPLLLPIVPH